ncbi:MAG: lipid-A-disaccharide synthase-related protein [Cyanobacteria bacterium P01_F01_bin.4]
MKPRLLCISNGHGEDAIALQILQHIQALAPEISLAALPIVGDGHRYEAHSIPVVGSTKVLPSGGFIYMDRRQLMRDVRGGLIGLTLTQIKAVRHWVSEGVEKGAANAGAVLAVGDIVPLLFGWLSGVPYGFVGTAKSDYYWCDESAANSKHLGLAQAMGNRLIRQSGSIYFPWERWLMQRPHCRCVFPRDGLTVQQLSRWSIPAVEAGNPMMDGLVISPLETVLEQASASPLTVLLLPGSRNPEAYQNWQLILQALDGVQQLWSGPSVEFVGAIAPSLDLEPLEQALVTAGWQADLNALEAKGEGERGKGLATVGWQDASKNPCYQRQGMTLTLSQSSFKAFAQQAQVAIALAGTATEQFVGLGKPAIILPGEGPQFNPTFAKAQTRLLGPSVILVNQPQAVGKTLETLLGDPQRLTQIYHNGRQRMGKPGAGRRISEQVLERLLGVVGSG